MNPYARHGWVIPLEDGLRAGCGGPTSCGPCGEELELLIRAHQALIHWLHYPPHDLGDLLFQMISKADKVNRELLRMGYPWEVLMWEMWQSATSNEAFMQKMKALETLRAPNKANP